MSTQTVTEALAEIKTIVKRLDKKHEFINGYLVRFSQMKDPHEKEGGSAELIRRERQASADLWKRLVDLRLAIQQANHRTPVTVAGTTKMLAEWLTWRKEVAPTVVKHLTNIRQNILANRKRFNDEVGKAKVQGLTVDDLIVNVDEAALAKEAEELETILSELDGQLSLKNATVMVDV